MLRLMFIIAVMLAGCATYPSAWYEITDEIPRTAREREESNRECMQIAEARSTAPAGFAVGVTTFVHPGVGIGTVRPVTVTNYDIYEMVWVACMTGRRYQLQKIRQEGLPPCARSVAPSSPDRIGPSATCQ